MEFSRLLLSEFYSEDPEANGTAAVGMMEGQDPIQCCCKLLREEHCLVVIDGLRSTEEWDLIKPAFLSEPTKSSVIVITNEETVLEQCAYNKYVTRIIKGLEADVALDLFTQALGSHGLNTAELEKVIGPKCGGLPKLIVDVGCNWMDIVIRINTFGWTFMDVLEMQILSLWDIFVWMDSYFEKCSDSLKPCVFYLSVFPAGHGIRRKCLLRRWIAEGYARDANGRSSEMNGGGGSVLRAG